MARAIWKGTIRFAGVEVPVKLYSAVQDRGVHFRLLHRKDKVPVKQRMVDPESGEVVEYEDVRRGYETDEGTFVILDEEELAEAEPEASRDIEITRFVPPAQINHQWYERPYFLGPDEDAEAYAALAEALGKKGLEGVARWVMRKKEYVGALRLEGEHLMLITLRHAGEVIPASALPQPGGRKPSEKEIAMAEQLVSALEDEFDPEDWQDEYRERVLELIEAKASGKTVKLERPKEKKATEESLAAVLEQSLEAAKESRAA